MFHATALDVSEGVTPLRDLGAVFIIESGSRSVFQPCPAFNGSACSIYSTRPQKCRSYECALLRSVNKGETDYADAVHVIERARTLANVVSATFTTESQEDESVEPHDVVRIGRTTTSAYLRVMETEYSPEQLSAAFPEAAELIDILRSSFGWNGGPLPTPTA